MIFPNIWHRTEGSEDAVFEDFTKQATEWVKALKRFEEEADSRFGMISNREADLLIKQIEAIKRRTNAIRAAINSEERERRMARRNDL